MLFAVAVSLIALPLPFLGMLGIYVLVNLFYSFWLKRKLVLDVMLLAGMYALRVLVGGVAADVVVSEWLLAFSMFLFTSLAFGKRHAELARHTDEEARTRRAAAVTASATCRSSRALVRPPGTWRCLCSRCTSTALK